MPWRFFPRMPFFVHEPYYIPLKIISQVYKEVRVEPAACGLLIIRIFEIRLRLFVLITGMTKFKKSRGMSILDPTFFHRFFFTFCVEILYHRFKPSRSKDLTNRFPVKFWTCFLFKRQKPPYIAIFRSKTKENLIKISRGIDLWGS